MIPQTTVRGRRGCDVVVGIDAGGSSTRARAIRQGAAQKLQARAIRIVMDLGGLDEFQARQRLEATHWSVRAALQSGPSAS